MTGSETKIGKNQNLKKKTKTAARENPLGVDCGHKHTRSAKTDGSRTGTTRATGGDASKGPVDDEEGGARAGEKKASQKRDKPRHRSRHN